MLERPEDPDQACPGALRDIGIEGDGVELVRDTGVEVELDRDAGEAQAPSVLEVFVAEDVELADLDVGRR
jgi:hypothetical protein